MNQPASISIIVISFNGASFVEDCLRTTIDSVGTSPYQIIVVDNGSTDNTREIIESRFPAVTVIVNKENRGFAAAVNQGLETASGEFIFLLNQDIRVQGDSILRLMDRLKKDSRIGVIGPKFVNFEGRLLKSARAFPRHRDLLFELAGLSYLFPRSKTFSSWKMGWFDHEEEQEVEQPMGAAMMFRRSLVEEVGRFDEAFPIFFNDVDFCRRVIEAGYRNLYYPSAVMEHFVGGSTSRRRTAMLFESHRSMYRYYLKYSRGLFDELLTHLCGLLLLLAALVRAPFSLFRRK